MTLQRPLEMQAAGGDTPFSYAAIATRQGHDLMWVNEGVVRLGLQVTQRGAGANMSVDVAAGSCVIVGDDVAGQGKYMCVSDAVTNVTVPAAPASGSRIHRVVARIKDKLHSGSWTTYEWTVELLADTGSGTPALPASAINLGRVTVVAGQVTVVNANITDDRVSALVAGSIPQSIASAAGRPPNPADGEEIWRSDVGYYEMWLDASPGPAQWAQTRGVLPKARISRSTNQLITSGSNTTLTLATADYNTSPSLLSGTTMLQPTIPGLYRATAVTHWASGTSGYYQARILDNSGAEIVGGSGYVPTTGVSPLAMCSDDINVTPGMVGTTAGQFLVSVFQNSGSSVNVTAAHLSIRYVGPYL